MRSGSNGSQAGFTLLEVIIALAIMTLAFASVLSIEEGGITAANKTHQMNIVSMLARDRMVQAEFEIEGKTFDEVRKEEEGPFKEPFQDYKWKKEVKEVKFPELGSFGGGGGGASGGASSGGVDPNADITEMLTKLMTNFLSKAIRELTVTIYWTAPDFKQSFSVTTYWVDLNHEFETTE